MEINIKEIAKILNQKVSIYSLCGKYTPASLEHFSCFITTTEFPEDSLYWVNEQLTHMFSFPAKYLQAIYDEYLDAFRDIIYHHALLHKGFEDLEYDQYLPDYIYQLIQMGTILDNGKEDTPREIASILKTCQESSKLNLQGLIDCIPKNAAQEALTDLLRYPYLY